MRRREFIGGLGGAAEVGLTERARVTRYVGGDGGAFYLPCCWEALAVTEARDHCCGVLPHHRKGRTPARSPSRGGTFQHGRSAASMSVMGAA
jgi:hypothetical protein